ncbi:MAG TPA: hypothetical protein VN941_07585 [Bradyrhizobium sp.]|nr:hypothetical protein [Bradyrhizobium sp.]
MTKSMRYALMMLLFGLAAVRRRIGSGQFLSIETRHHCRFAPGEDCVRH